MTTATLRFFIDFKSPYAFLAKDQVYALEGETGAVVDWLPYTLDIPAYLGSARLDADGRVQEQNRNAHQWRRVRYSYMDCRREANRRGLTIRGTQKIWDSSLANIGLLFARRLGVRQAYCDAVFERFWKRELDIENAAVLAELLTSCGVDGSGFAAFAADQGRGELRKVQAAAEAAGVFGVPSFLFSDGDLYWGREHLPWIKDKLLTARGAAAD